ncbi:unnamed protein product [Rangifer tarandus platyrhynchus]|uniref:Uncharacterized protein n=1 Tax=Rangifer tarandus platyrhynchus TaxID=3082113 RepID=A0AC59ZXN3_RANTA
MNKGWIPRVSPAPCLEEAGSTAGREKQLVPRLPSTEHSPDVKRAPQPVQPRERRSLSRPPGGLPGGATARPSGHGPESASRSPTGLDVGSDILDTFSRSDHISVV